MVGAGVVGGTVVGAAVVGDAVTGDGVIGDILIAYSSKIVSIEERIFSRILAGITF